MSTTNLQANANNQNLNKPVSFGFDASSWNYGAFYPIEPYKSKSRSKVNVDYTPPINRDFKECYNFKNQANSNQVQTDTVKHSNIGRRTLNREEKIIRDDLVRNMNLLKLTGTSKNFSNKPTLVVNPVTNKVVSHQSNDNSQITIVSPLNKNNISNHGNTNNLSKINDTNLNNLSRVSNVNTKNKPGNAISNNNKNLNQSNHSQNLKKSNSIISNESTLKYQLKYDEWLRVKKQQTEIEKSIKMVQEQENLKLEGLKKKIKQEYDPIKDEKLKKWMEEKKQKKKEVLIKKLTKEEEIERAKEQKRIEKEAKMEQWLIKQAQILELKEREKQLQEEIEKRKKEQEEANKQTKRVEAMNAYKIWMMKKEEERIILEQLKVQGYEMNNGVIVQPKEKKENQKNFNRNKKLKLVIGPYTDAKVYRKIQKIIEDQLEDNENNNENIDQGGEELDNYEDLDSAGQVDKVHANNMHTGETDLELNEEYMDNEQHAQNQDEEEGYNGNENDNNQYNYNHNHNQNSNQHKAYNQNKQNKHDDEMNNQNHKLEQINEMNQNNQEYEDEENYEGVEDVDHENYQYDNDNQDYQNNQNDNVEVYDGDEDYNNYQ